ncbi:IS701 family transposase, partial [Roseomonas mucosa]
TGRPRSWPMRRVVDAILYVLRTGCAWAHLPRDFPPPGTVHRWFPRLSRRGTFERLAHALIMADRERVGREASPRAAVLDAQSARSGGVGVKGVRGYDAGKKVTSRKRHALVDTDGRLLLAAVSPACLHDSRGGAALLAMSRRPWPFLARCFADRAYAGPRIALGQIRQALAEGVPTGIVLSDAGYGDETAFRAGVDALGLHYVLGLRPGTTVWPPGTGPLPPAPWSGRGRPPTRLRRGPQNQPAALPPLAGSLAPRAWRKVTWREGTRAELTSRFAALRVRPAHRDTLRPEPWPEEWLLIEWPEGSDGPTKYWLSNLPPRTTLRRLVHTAKARWLIERDYQELKQEIGLGHYEGRGWRGFHHHASLSIAAYGFLVAERCLSPPRHRGSRDRLGAPALPEGFRPRGAAPA